jgi:sphingosine kinase
MMENLHHKFILRSKNEGPCTVNINLYEGNYWMITLSDTNKRLYDINSNEIIACKTVRNFETEEEKLFSQWAIEDDDEGIMEDGACVEPSKVILTIYENGAEAGLGKEPLALSLQILQKDRETGYSICQNLTEKILRSMLTESTDVTTSVNNKGKRILLLSNPKSGKGNATKLTEEIVLPLIKDRSINYDLLVTQRANQACNFVAGLPTLLHRYSSIAIVSGDGLVYEIYQGLMTRTDWEVACKMPIAIIPGGSGNGLAKSVVHFQDKDINSGTTDKDYAKHCATNLVDGIPRPMDMSCIQTSAGTPYISFLSFSWGFGAEVDIESEKIRFLGGARFTVWTLYSLMKMGSSRARISYKPIKTIKTESAETASSSFRRNRKRLEESETSSGTNTSDDTGIDDISTINLHDDLNKFPLSEEVSKTLGYSNKLQDILHAPSICTDVSSLDEWSVIDDSFVMVMILSKPWIAKDICMAPQFEGMDDGVMWLLMIREGISRSRMLRIMMGFRDGSHTNFPEAEMIPVTAVRMEPIGEKGTMVVDGEQIESGTIQAEILPSFANIVY